MKIARLLLVISFFTTFFSCSSDDVTFEERKDLDEADIVDFLNKTYFTADGEVSQYPSLVQYNIDKFYDSCYELVYPLTMDTSGELKAVNNQYELEVYLANNQSAIFSYPFKMIKDGSTVTANNETEALEALKACHTELINYASRLDSGVYIVNRPGKEGTGVSPSIEGTDEILIQMNIGTILDQQYVTSIRNTSPVVTPYLYDWDYETDYVSSNGDDTELTLEEQESARKYREIEGFIEGLSHFKASGKSIEDLYDFQGLIIVPSALAYGTEPSNYLQFNTNAIAVFTIDLYQVF